MFQDQFRNAEDEYFRLKGQLAIGRITREQFDAAMRALQTQDAGGNDWRIDPLTNRWNRKSGEAWEEADPPQPMLTEPPATLPEQAALARVAPRRAPNRAGLFGIVGGGAVCCLAIVVLGFGLNRGAIQIAFLNTATPTATSTPVATATPTFSPTPTQTFTPSASPTPSLTPTLTPRPTATPTRTPLPPAPNVTFKFGEGVPADERQIIQDGIAMAYQFFGDAGPLTVVVTENLDALMTDMNSFFRRSPAGAAAVQDRRDLETGVHPAFQGSNSGASAVWVYYVTRWKNYTPEFKLHEMAHEYFHSLQKFIAKRTDSEQIGPIWYIEGGAEYESYRVTENLGLADKDEVDKSKIQSTWGLSMSLSNMETKKGAFGDDNKAVYDLGYMATRYLAQNFGEATVARKFWETRPTVATWQDAFKVTFGISIQEFYQRFEAYRAAQIKPLCGQVGAPPSADLAIQFVRRFPAGVTTIQNRQYSNAPNIGYLFCFKGMQFGLLDNDQQIAAFVRPRAASGWLSCGGNCVIVYMSPSVSAGSYTVGLSLSDGRHAENSFEHTLDPTPTRSP